MLASNTLPIDSGAGRWNGASFGGVRVGSEDEKGFAVVRAHCAIFLLSGSSASATTYTYVGQPFTSFSGLCNELFCSSITGSVTFALDTSTFSGTLGLSDVEKAVLSEGSSRNRFRGSHSRRPSCIPFLLPLLLPIQTSEFLFSSNFTLVNGAITSWLLEGGTDRPNCGGGPGCATVNHSLPARRL